MTRVRVCNYQPRFQHPELLCHPWIPDSLFGVNPRTIRGAEWWDTQRAIAYRENNYCCWACGEPESEDNWLEAHESYTYDPLNLILRFLDVSALCMKCHAFIHAGYLRRRVAKSAVTYTDAVAILTRGAAILQKAGLTPYYETIQVCKSFEVPVRDPPDIPSYDDVMRFKAEAEQETGTRYRGVHCLPLAMHMPNWRLLLNGQYYTQRDITT